MSNLIKILSIISLVCLITFEASGETQLECQYGVAPSWIVMWNQFKYCLVQKADLSQNRSVEGFVFSGSADEKSQATAVEFYKSPDTIDFIPHGLVEEFPQLNGISITDSNVPVIKNDFFGDEFSKIQYLSFYHSKVEVIEPDAFLNLPALKWLQLTSNKIEFLMDPIFKFNTKLEYFNAEDNNIKMINPELFDGLNRLKLVNLRGNICIDDTVGCEECFITPRKLNEKLQFCFRN